MGTGGETVRSPSPAGTELRPVAALTGGDASTRGSGALPPAPTPQGGAGSLAAQPGPDEMRKPSEQQRGEARAVAAGFGFAVAQGSLVPGV